MYVVGGLYIGCCDVVGALKSGARGLSLDIVTVVVACDWL